MANKTFNQYCPIAHSLDLIGDRWTLLIIRNLTVGAKRFSDLLRGLPGISPNILTDRLKALQDDQIVTTRYLPPPAASTVYELTDAGRSLLPILIALSQWGSQTLPQPNAERFIVTEGIQFMIIGVFDRQNALPVTLSCNVHIKDALYDHTFGVVLAPSGATVTEEGLHPVAAELQIGLESVAALASKRVSLDDLIHQNLAQLTGSQVMTESLLKWFMS